jgi:hypothetical protein
VENVFGTTKVWNDDHYYTALAAAGAAKYLDCVGVRYTQGAVSPATNRGDSRGSYPVYYFNGMLNRALKVSRDKPVCFTQFGYLSPEGLNIDTKVAWAWAKMTTVAQQAQWLAEAAALSAKSGKVRLMIIFNIDFTVRGLDPTGGWAIIRPDGTCPACDALAKVLPPFKAAAATPASTSVATPALAGTATPGSGA